MTRNERIQETIKGLCEEAIKDPSPEIMRALAKNEKVVISYDFKRRRLKALIVKEEIKEVSLA